MSDRCDKRPAASSPVPTGVAGRWSVIDGWELAQLPVTGEISGATNWLSIKKPQTAAAALRDVGGWDPSNDMGGVDAHAWAYRCRIQLPENVPREGGSWTLVFEGLATIARVSIRGTERLATRNMFRRHEVAIGFSDVDEHGCVDVSIRIESLTEALKQRRPRPRWRTPMVGHPQLRWWRTTLLGRTPGWSPPSTAAGPWRPIWLEHRSTLEFVRAEVRTSVILRDGTAVGQLNVVLAGISAQASRVGKVVVLDGAGNEAATAAVQKHADGGAASCTIPNVQLWWPHTHGEPYLYEVWLHHADVGQRQLLARVGFRTIEVDQSKGGFALRVNGEPVFCRGGCWMPPDVVSMSATREQYAHAVREVRAVGMNMVRLAGATVYEADEFFDACDAHGVLVWQDLMLSNMDYPADDPTFVDEVRAEVFEQMGRIAHRASLAVICGNSEVEQQAAMSGAPRDLWQPELFHRLVPQWLQTCAPDVAYWPSSAHGGAFPHQPNQGTTSYYGVGAYRRELNDALHSGVRFATEALAIANVPNRANLEELGGGVVPQVHTPTWKSRVYRDLGVGWDFDDVREHYVRHWLGVDPDALRAYDPERHLVLGRLVSAELMARTFALWRSVDSSCQGALIWYLRDLWPGAGCGMFDHKGRRKSAAHALARVLQPVFATWVDEGLNGLSLHICNETQALVDGVGKLTLYQGGRVRKFHAERHVTVPARGALKLSLCDWTDGWVDSNWTYKFGPPGWDLVEWEWARDDGSRLAQAIHVAPTDMCRDVGPIEMTGSAKRMDDGRVLVSLSSQAAAYGVHFDLRGWEPSDEYFHVMPGGSHDVLFTPDVPHAHWHATAHAVNSQQVLTLLLSDGKA